MSLAIALKEVLTTESFTLRNVTVEEINFTQSL